MPWARERKPPSAVDGWRSHAFADRRRPGRPRTPRLWIRRPCELALKAAAGKLKALENLPDLVDPKISKRMIEALKDADWDRPPTAMAKAFIEAWKEAAEEEEAPAAPTP